MQTTTIASPSSSPSPRSLRDFLKAGHLPTLLTSFLYFDLTFAVWVLNAAMAPFISEELHLSHGQTGTMLAVPVFAGALMRFPLGVLSQYIGKKRAALVEMSLIMIGLAIGWLFVSSFASVIAMGIVLGVAGASFGVALSLGSASYPPRYKGLAMGIAGAGNSGAVLAMLFAPPLAKALGWRSVYGVAILPMLVAMLLLQFLAREPVEREQKRLRDYLVLIVDKDMWVFNVMYMVTFGGYIGLTSFLPTLFHEQYGIPKQSIGAYAATIIIAASILRVAGGWLADRIGGVRLLLGMFALVATSVFAAATLPASPRVMVAILVVAFCAMGAGNGAVFQLVPLRFKGSTTVAGSLVGEIGALAGGLLPALMGFGKQWTGSYSFGFGALIALAIGSTMALALVARRWTRTWVGKGGLAHEVVGVALPLAAEPEVDAEPAGSRAAAISVASAVLLAVLVLPAVAHAQGVPTVASVDSAPYSQPWQLRPVAVASVFRVDTSVARYENPAADSGTTVATMLYGAYRVTPRFAPFVRLGIVSDTPPTGDGAASFVNPAIGAVYLLPLAPPFRAGVSLAMTLPLGMGGGDMPSATTASATKSGVLARAGMDNAMFAVNDLAIFPGIDVAWVAHGFTVQGEATVFQLVRVRGSKVQPDAAKTNLTTGLAIGYAVIPALSVVGELRYQRYLSTPSFVTAMPALRDTLSIAGGVRGRVKLGGKRVIRPGLAYARGLDDPLENRSYNLVLVDLTMVF